MVESSPIFFCSTTPRKHKSSVTPISCAPSTWTTLSLEMPKKKKTQQKPIPRGVAVTSIPKKAPPEPLRQDDSDAKVEFASAEGSHTAQPHELVEDETVSRQKAEERSLQDLVDRLQERTEKEIVRTIKVRGWIRQMSQRALAHSPSHSGHRNGKAILQHFSVVRPRCWCCW